MSWDKRVRLYTILLTVVLTQNVFYIACMSLANCMAIIITIIVTHLNIIQEMRSYSNGKKAHECIPVCVYVSVQVVLLIYFLSMMRT